MVLDADENQHAAVRQHPDIRRLEAGHPAKLAFAEFHGSVSALLRIECEAHADPASVGLAGRLPFADSRKIDLVAGDIQRSDIVAGIELHTRRCPVRKLGGGHDILPPQLERLAPKLARDLVDQPLDCKGCARPRDAATRAHGSLVGGDGVSVELQVPDAIGAGQIARRHARFLKGARRPQGVSAGIDVDIAFDPQKRAVTIGRYDQVVGVVARVHRREEMFAPVLDPPHRMLHLHRDRGDGDVFRHDAVLPAEAAADVGSDDANLLLRQAEHPRQRETLDLATLGRQVDDQLVKPVVPVGEHSPAFERNGRLAVQSKPAAQPYRRGAQRRWISLHHRGGDVGIVGPLIEHPRAIRTHCSHGVDDGWQFLELDTDFVRQILGLRPRRHHAGRYRLSDVANAAIGQWGIRAVAMRGQFRPRLQNVDRADLGQREYAPCRFRGLDHLAYVGIRHLAAHECDVLDTRYVDIRNEHAASVQVASILLAQQAGADPASGLFAISHCWRFPVLRIRLKLIVCERAGVNRTAGARDGEYYHIRPNDNAGTKSFGASRDGAKAAWRLAMGAWLLQGRESGETTMQKDRSPRHELNRRALMAGGTAGTLALLTD